MSDITIIDYGVGNILSVKRGFEYFGASTTLTAEPSEIYKANKLVLPGVGAFGVAMDELNRLGLVEVIRDKAKGGTPLLGICLGMQMLLEQSNEFGSHQGLGLITGNVVPIPTHSKDGKVQKIPHIGWNQLITPEHNQDFDNPLLKEIKQGDSVYFVHSFMVMPEEENDRVADCLYGGNRISAVICKNNIYGCQFHPEKSGEAGLRILKNYFSL